MLLQVETRDPKTGEMLRLNEDDDSTTLGEMLRQERFGGGMADQKNLDAELAGAIMGDGKFQVSTLFASSRQGGVIAHSYDNRMISSIWMTMQIDWVERRCAQTL